MAQNTMVAASDVLARYNHAAAMLATTVDVMQRISSDPTYAADRSPKADEVRSGAFEEMLAEFRAAKEALYASTAPTRELRRPVDVTETIEAAAL